MSDLPSIVDEGAPANIHHLAMAEYLATLKEGRSRYTTLQSLALVGRALGYDQPASVPWADVRSVQVSLVKAELERQGYAGATINKALAAVRGVLRSAWRQGELTTDELHRAIDVRGVKAAPLPRGRALRPPELARVLRSCPQTPLGVRDCALLAVLAGCGLRRAELAELLWRDLEGVEDFAAVGMLHVRHGKGGKGRRVPVPDGTLRALRRWQGLELLSHVKIHETYIPEVQGEAQAPRPMFPGLRYVHGVWRVQRGPLRPNSILAVCKRAAVRAKVEPFSPHDLRRTCLTAYLDAGAGELVTQQIAGHASTDTTRRYDRRGDAAMVAASLLIAVPSPPANEEVIGRIAHEDADGDPDGGLDEGGPKGGPDLGGSEDLGGGR